MHYTHERLYQIYSPCPNLHKLLTDSYSGLNCTHTNRRTQILLLFLSDVFMLNRCSLNTHTQENGRLYQAWHGSQCDPFTSLQQRRLLNSSTIQVLSCRILSLSVIKTFPLLLELSFPTVSNKHVGQYPIMQCTLLCLQVWQNVCHALKKCICWLAC